MFGRIAPRYDLLNHLLSMNIDRYWRSRTVSRVATILSQPGAWFWMFAAAPAIWRSRSRSTRPSALRFSAAIFRHPMLVAARRKTQPRQLFRSRCLAASNHQTPRSTWLPSRSDFAISTNYQRRLDRAAAYLEARRHARDSGILHSAERAARAALRLLLASDPAHRRRNDSRARRTPTPTCRNQCANFPMPKVWRIKCAMRDS